MMKLVALFGLGLGPIIAILLKRHRAALLALDAFVVVTITGLVLCDILPQSLRAGGLYTIVAMALGAMIPMLLHGSTDTCNHQERTPILLGLGWLALACHAFMDGLGISCSQIHDHHHHHHGFSLHIPLAMTLHRIIEGMGLWWLFRPYLGIQRTVAILMALAATTGVGILLGEQLHAHAAPLWLTYIQAGLAGSLLHVLFRHGPPSPTQAIPPLHANLASLGGVALALLALSYLLVTHGAGEHALPFDHGRWDIIEQMIMATMLAWFVTALLHVWLPNPHVQSPLLSPTLAPIHGAWVALLAGDCICGNMRLFAKWLKEGLSGRAALTFLTATATIGTSIGIVTYCCFDSALSWYRLFVGLFGSLSIGLLLGNKISNATPAQSPSYHAHQQPTSIDNKWLDGIAYLREDIIPHQLPWLLVGLCCADVLSTSITPEIMAWLVQSAWHQLLLMAVALPLYISPIGITPIAYVLWSQGLPLGTLLAIMWICSATSVSQYHYLKRHHGASLARWHTGLVTLLGLLLVLSVYVWPSFFGMTIWTGVNVPQHQLLNQLPQLRWLVWTGFVVIVLAYLSTIQIRSFLAPVMLPNTRAIEPHQHHNHHHV